MYYVSTRGRAAPAVFSDILLEGLASDGGLYVPAMWPQISLAELESWRCLSYAELAAKIIGLFAPEIPQTVLARLTAQAYRADVFGNVRVGQDATAIFPVMSIGQNLHLLQLSGGPTLAFKDAAMQLLGLLLEWALEEKGERLTVLGATSGDTGSAAIHALRGRKNIRLVMLSPQGRMSDFQRAQMYSVQDENILNLAVDGCFDDCQDLVKQLHGEAAFKERHSLGAVNSINWARIAAQIVYYVYAYLRVAASPGAPVSFSVPSGNFGNVYAGMAARIIGVPTARLIVATNENDVLHRALETGVYAPEVRARVTSSPSMDITKASNFERAVYEASCGDGARVSALFEYLNEAGKIDFVRDSPDIWAGMCGLGLCSSRSTHAARLKQIQAVFEESGLFIDPHTADGFCGAQAHQEEGEQIVILETAAAAKFASTVRKATGREPPRPAAFEGLEEKPQKFRQIAKDAQVLRNEIERFNNI